MIYFLVFVVTVLAVARGTVLVLEDEITRPWRERRLAKHPPGTKIHKLLTCYWCFGFWASLLAVTNDLVAAWIGHTYGWMPWGAVAWLPTATFGVAYAACWILDKEKERERRDVWSQ